MNKPPSYKTVTTIKHEDTRKNIPTAEFQSVLDEADARPVDVRYERRNRDLDPQLVWRGKDQQNLSDLVVAAPPLYIQEKVHPKALIDDLMRQKAQPQPDQQEFDLFSDFNGVPEGADKTEFYQHDQNWSNRMILGDSLQVMASLAEREGLRGKVQCIYIDPPYGIKFNSNFQWSTTSRDVKDGNADHITREPEMVKAFRDTWRYGIHSYLGYLRDRLIAARELLTDSGSIFVQIGDENVHRIRALLDEVFSESNFVSTIQVTKTGSQSGDLLSNVADSIIWYARNRDQVKYRKLLAERPERGADDASPDPVMSSGHRANTSVPFTFRNHAYDTGPNYNWKTHLLGMERLARADRLIPLRTTLRYARYYDDYPVKEGSNIWSDLGGATDLIYVVQTATKVVQRCLVMTTDPGDLVLDPTCGSGTTAYVAEQWGRRWITIDTSRVALALARARIMGARYPYYYLKDTAEGQAKLAEITKSVPSGQPTGGDVRMGFVYERVPHITLKSIANNASIDVIWDTWQGTLEPLRIGLNTALGKSWEEWEIPRDADEGWSPNAKHFHAEWWEARIKRQKEIDASIAANAEYENLYDKPYEDKKRVRVAGPFTVESLSPHRMVAVDENDEPIQNAADSVAGYPQSFVSMVIENLKSAGVQQAHKDGKLDFTSLELWPGNYVCAEGTYEESSDSIVPTVPSAKDVAVLPSTKYQTPYTAARRAAIFIGPEFGTVQRTDLVEAAREAAEAGFDVLVACAFNYDAQSTDFGKLGRLPILKARMNAELHMDKDLKPSGGANLFVVFGEPDIELINEPDGKLRVRVIGVDVFKPQTGEVISSSPDEIACWFIDTDYNSESFFVRQAYFLGANDPYSSLKTSLKAEIDADAWASLHSDISRPFEKPTGGRIAVKVINHLGDEVMKVFRV